MKQTNTFPNEAEGEARQYRCKLCGRQPPEITYNHFRSSTICTGCQVILAVAYPLIFIVCGVALLWGCTLLFG